MVGLFPKLEDSMVAWARGEASPDRLDLLVWTITAFAERKGLGGGKIPPRDGLHRESPYDAPMTGLAAQATTMLRTC